MRNTFLLLKRSPYCQLLNAKRERFSSWCPFCEGQGRLSSSSTQFHFSARQAVVTSLLHLTEHGKNQASDFCSLETIEMVLATYSKERRWGIFSIRYIFLYFATIFPLRCPGVNTKIRAAGSQGPSVPNDQQMKKQFSFLPSPAPSKSCVRKTKQEKPMRQDGGEAARCWEIGGFTTECGTPAKLYGTGSEKQL